MVVVLAQEPKKTRGNPRIKIVAAKAHLPPPRRQTILRANEFAVL